MSYFEFCRHTVQKNAPDLYLISLMGRGHDLNKLWTVLAFEYEISKIRRIVSEPTLALIRLQWWRDEFDKITQGQPHSRSEVLSSIVACDFDLADLRAMLDSKEAEIRLAQPPQSAEEALAYITEQHLPLCKMIAKIDGANLDIAETIKTTALNRGLVDALYRARDKSFVDVHKSDLIKNFDNDLTTKGRMISALSSHAKLHFKCLKRAKFDVSDPHLRRPPALEALRIWTSVLGK